MPRSYEPSEGSAWIENRIVRHCTEKSISLKAFITQPAFGGGKIKKAINSPTLNEYTNGQVDNSKRRLKKRFEAKKKTTKPIDMEGSWDHDMDDASTAFGSATAKGSTPSKCPPKGSHHTAPAKGRRVLRAKRPAALNGLESPAKVSRHDGDVSFDLSSLTGGLEGAGIEEEPPRSGEETIAEARIPDHVAQVITDPQKFYDKANEAGKEANFSFVTNLNNDRRHLTYLEHEMRKDGLAHAHVLGGYKHKIKTVRESIKMQQLELDALVAGHANAEKTRDEELGKAQAFLNLGYSAYNALESCAKFKEMQGESDKATAMGRVNEHMAKQEAYKTGDPKVYMKILKPETRPEPRKLFS